MQAVDYEVFLCSGGAIVRLVVLEYMYVWYERGRQYTLDGLGWSYVGRMTGNIAGHRSDRCPMETAAQSKRSMYTPKLWA